MSPRSFKRAALAIALLAVTASSQAVAAPVASLGRLDAPPGYQRVDPPITDAQFTTDVAQISQAPWEWQWSAAGAEFARSATSVSSADSVVHQIETGHVGFNADLPGLGTSLLGVPNAQSLVHSTVMASKTVNGELFQAICYFEVFTGTPHASRQITYGAAWQCNQPWVRGAVAAGLGGLNYADGSFNEHALRPGDESYVPTDEGWTPTKTLYIKKSFTREFETQLEDLYGYIDLKIDDPHSTNDAFFGQPSAEGAYRSYKCNHANAQDVACEIITAPFSFVPTNDTNCDNGACDLGTIPPVPSVPPTPTLPPTPTPPTIPNAPVPGIGLPYQGTVEANYDSDTGDTELRWDPQVSSAVETYRVTVGRDGAGGGTTTTTNEPSLTLPGGHPGEVINFAIFIPGNPYFQGFRAVISRDADDDEESDLDATAVPMDGLGASFPMLGGSPAVAVLGTLPRMVPSDQPIVPCTVGRKDGKKNDARTTFRVKFSKQGTNNGNRFYQYHMHYQVRSPFRENVARTTLRASRILPNGQRSDAFDDSLTRRDRAVYKRYYAHFKKLQVKPETVISYVGEYFYAEPVPLGDGYYTTGDYFIGSCTARFVA